MKGGGGEVPSFLTYAEAFRRFYLLLVTRRLYTVVNQCSGFAVTHIRRASDARHADFVGVEYDYLASMVVRNFRSLSRFLFPAVFSASVPSRTALVFSQKTWLCSEHYLCHN